MLTKAVADPVALPLQSAGVEVVAILNPGVIVIGISEMAGFPVIHDKLEFNSTETVEPKVSAEVTKIPVPFWAI